MTPPATSSAGSPSPEEFLRADGYVPATVADFAATARDVAPTVLGWVVVHDEVAVRIVEVEAYEGEIDPGSHAFRGRTDRNSALFGPPGTAYVYLNYGLHHALNLVCGEDGRASGCLVRAGEVIAGLDVARTRRTTTNRRTGQAQTPPDVQLARGPGNLAKTLGLDLTFTGVPITADVPTSALTVWKPHPPRTSAVRTGPRVGVSGPGGVATHYPWRYWIPDDRHVSAYRKAPDRTRRRAT